MHCEDPGCLKACPAPGAIVQYSNGIVDFVHENCIGCGYCVKGCPFNIPRISKVDNKAYKCTLCSDRVAVGQGPACAKACPTQAIVFGTKDEMTNMADERITDLKSRGFENAGLYDPPGVGGTHVMYVLHHADQPQLYAGLPNDPRISPLVEAWKGVTKYAGLAVDRPVRRVRLPASPRRRAQPGHEGGRGERRAAGWEEERCHDAIRRRRNRATASIRATRSWSTATPPGARINHWITATSLVLLALSGLALFHPVAVFPDRAVRRRAMDAGDPSLDRRGAVLQLPRPVPPLLEGSISGSARTAPGWRSCATCSPATRRTCPRSASTMPARSSCSGRCRS